MIVIPASLRSDFIHMAGMTIHIALESTIHIVGIRSASPELVRIMLRVMYQAAIAEYQVQPHDVAYFDVTNAVRMRSSVDDCDLATTIDNGCNTLAGMV